MIAGGGAMVAEGTSVTYSFTDEIGNVGDTGFGLADHLLRYGQRGSGEGACCRSDTSEDFYAASVLRDSSLLASMEKERVTQATGEGERSV